MQEDDEVCLGKMLGAGDVVCFKFIFLTFFRIDGHGWIHLTFFINGEEDCAVETMVLAKYFCHHGHGLFAAVFLFSSDKHDMFSFSWTLYARVCEPRRAFWNGIGMADCGHG